MNRRGNRTRTREEFIEISKSIFGDTYDYSKVVYMGSETLVTVICRKHGEFLIKPVRHICYKVGCSFCLGSRWHIIDFIEKANVIHGSKYDYSKTIITESEVSVIIGCPIHGEFIQKPYKHIHRKHGCPLCDKTHTKTIEHVIRIGNQVHHNKYDYSKAILVNMSSKIEIICDNVNHGSFWQNASSHLRGTGCPKCTKVVSGGEIAWLDHLSIPLEWRQVSATIENAIYKFDAFDPNTKTVYEFYGDYWHGNPEIFDPNLVNKNNNILFKTLYDKTITRENKLKQLGYTVVSIWENDFNKLLIK